MGSGISGKYSGHGGSQPYAPLYHVAQDMLDRDVAKGTYHNGRYDKNPTAKNIRDMINGNYVGDKNTCIEMPYVIDSEGNIIVGRRNGNGRNGAATPHPTLIGGRDPQVQMAGMVYIQGGKIISYNNRSGHYRPNNKSMEVAHKAFGKLPKSVFKMKRGR